MKLSQPRKVRRTIFIGLGGTGDQVIRHLKEEMLKHQYDLPLFQYLVLDTMAFDEKPGTPLLRRLRNGEEYLNIGNYNPNEVLKNIGNWPSIARWWGNRAKTNLAVVDEGAGQMRSVGRMGFFYHFSEVELQFRRMVQEITSITNRDNALLKNYDVSENDPIIYIVFSLCGGTGSSLFFDTAYVLRHMLNSVGLKPTIVGVAMLPGPYLQAISSIPQQERIQANGYAALMELERLHNIALGLEPRPNGKDIWSVQYSTNYRVDSAELPFDYIYLIDDKTVKGQKLERVNIYTALGKAIFWLSGPSTATDFWSRAKNLSSKTLASGGVPDAAGRKRLTLYSSLGISTVLLEWTQERMQYKLENMFITQMRTIAPAVPILPRYLNNENTLVEELSGEATGVNPFPPNKALQATGALKDSVALQEMLTRFTEKYQLSLNSFARLKIWYQRREDCKKDIIDFINKHIAISLCKRGPVATTHELETIRQRLVTLRTSLEEAHLKAQERKRTLDEEYLDTSPVAQPQGRIQQTFANLLKFLAGLYLFKPFRPSMTSRELAAEAQQKAAKRYQWYQTQYDSQVYNDIINTVLSPLTQYIEQQKANYEDTDHNLEKLHDDNQQQLLLLNQQQATIPNSIDRIRPSLSEQGKIEEAIKTGRLKIDAKVEDIFQQAFTYWPKPGRSVIGELRSALSQAVSDTLVAIGGVQHLVQFLCEPDFEIQRKGLLTKAECMWNFAPDTNQNILNHLEPIELLGYGVNGHQGLTRPEDFKPILDELLKHQSKQPDTVATDIGDELVLLKTSHGLPISAIRSMPDLQNAYQIMDKVRGAPYLHIDYADEVRVGYGPLSSITRTYEELMKQWFDEASDIDHSNPQLADKIRTILRTFKLTLDQHRIHIGTIVEAQHKNDLIFDFIDQMRAIIVPQNQTPSVAQALMHFVELENILHAQGWIKIEPTYGERFNSDQHAEHSSRPEPGMPANRVLKVHLPGYIRHSSTNAGNINPPVRKAQVDISN